MASLAKPLEQGKQPRARCTKKSQGHRRKIMKKILSILVVLIGFGVSANAQTCSPSGNVEPKISYEETDSKALYYSLENTNDYKVTVTVWVVYKGEKVSNETTHVIKPGEKIGRSNWLRIKSLGGRSGRF